MMRKGRETLTVRQAGRGWERRGRGKVLQRQMKGIKVVKQMEPKASRKQKDGGKQMMLRRLTK
jgi:hypothetical protein